MKIKPCEKCGGWPYIIKVGDHRNLYVYKCSSCGFIKAKTCEARGNPIDALKVWNYE